VTDPPVVVFAHGFDAEPETYLPLLDAWAAAGYLVAAPEFPGSAANLPGTPVETDIGEQALDISFVISQLLGGVAGPLDTTRIAAAGHSDGGSTVATLALNPAYANPRIKAYLVLSGAIPSNTVGGSWGTSPVSGTLLGVVGDNDEYGNLPATTSVVDTADIGTKALVTVPGGDHAGIYIDGGPTPDAVRATTVSYLKAALATPSAPPAENQLIQTLQGASSGAFGVSSG
jgi:pimeloyl-ACP methyl ester carboxylesterase